VPVIVYLKDIAECNKFGKKLKQGQFAVFDATASAKLDTNLSTLDLIKKTPAKAPQVILTTQAASFGINFYPRAYPIMTEKPTTETEY
jgi:hypothetical protein